MDFKLGDLREAPAPDIGQQTVDAIREQGEVDMRLAANPDGALRWVHIRNGLDRLQREADHLLLEARRGEHTESIPYLETVVEATTQARRNFR